MLHPVWTEPCLSDTCLHDCTWSLCRGLRACFHGLHGGLCHILEGMRNPSRNYIFSSLVELWVTKIRNCFQIPSSIPPALGLKMPLGSDFLALLAGVISAHDLYLFPRMVQRTQRIAPPPQSPRPKDVVSPRSLGPKQARNNRKAYIRLPISFSCIHLKQTLL